MRCPVCGAKMVQNELCKYCGVTSDQIRNASNKKVVEYRKKDMADLICFTTNVPDDVNKIRLLLYTIFLGLIGVNHFYVKRNVRGWFSVISVFVSIVFVALALAVSTVNSVLVFRLLYEISIASLAINIILWIFDIFNVIFKKFKVPVVLAEKGADKK